MFCNIWCLMPTLIMKSNIIKLSNYNLNIWTWQVTNEFLKMFLASWINFQKNDTDRESFWIPVSWLALGLLNINKGSSLIRTFDDSLMDIIFIIILFSIGLFNTNLIALGWRQFDCVWCYLRINKRENREIEWRPPSNWIH